MQNHPIVHVEIPSKDVPGAGKFYNDVFGWKVENMPEMNYVTFESQEGMGGGFAEADGETYKTGDVVVYIQTDDIDTSLSQIISLGGEKMLSKTEIPGMGWYAFFRDPFGNRLGLFTPMMPG